MKILNRFPLLPSLLGSVFLSWMPMTYAEILPVHLNADGCEERIAVTANPVFSWRVESTQRHQVQSAWQILVASSADLLASNQGDFWDSGKQLTSRSPFVAYGGKPLQSGAMYYWKVRCWDLENQASSWSKPARIEVAPTTKADWHEARWIGDDRNQPEEDKDFYLPDPAPLLRKEFTLTKPILRARWHIAGLGYAIPSLNGRRIPDAPLDPPWTAFDKRILFRSHDVTSSLHAGKNCIGISLGNGWYNPLPLRMWGQRNIRSSLPVGRPRVISYLVVEHPDGTSTKITSGADWQTAPGATLRNSIYLGEERDARLEISGWDQPGFSAEKWQAARVIDAPMEMLRPLLDMPPVLPTETFAVANVKTMNQGKYIVDFGKNFTGVPVIQLDGEAGKKLIIRYGETLRADGSLNPLTSVCGQIKGKRKNSEGKEALIGGPGAPEFAYQEDHYITRGGKETFRPDFTFHAFRYMEISGLENAPKQEDIHGVRLHSALPEVGSFSCSNERFNRIQEITRNTFVNNVVSVQSDCPHRERFGYGGDIAVTSEAFLMNYDMAGFYAKTIRDWADAARPDGNFTDTAPFVGVNYCGVGWAMVHPLLLEQHFQHYGNMDLIKEQLPFAIRWFDLESSKRQGGLVTYGLGDHEAFEQLGGAPVATPMFINTARRIARLCRIMGMEKDAIRYDMIASESTAAWTKQFLNSTTGKVGNGTQTEQILPLGFNIIGNAIAEEVFSSLLKDGNLAATNPSLTTGIFGTRFLLEQLSQRDQHQIAYSLANRTAYPSWGHMVDRGATTLWETWKESDNTYSHNHPMFGSISAWFYRHLGGIQVMDDAVGFDRILIRPQPVADLTWVNCTHRSIRGPIVSNWKISSTQSEYEIVIPPNTTAVIELPYHKGDLITESGHSLVNQKHIEILPRLERKSRFKVRSGNFRFLIKHK